MKENKADQKSIEHLLVLRLKKKKYKVTTAESCTGGMAASMIVNVTGASKVFEQAFITYSNQSKHKRLGVKKTTLKKYTEVSKQTAGEMAKGAAKAARTDAAVSITGIAGPDGGTKTKPVGLVYIGCFLSGKTKVKKFIFKGNREKIRKQAAEQSLFLLYKMLLEENVE